MSIISLCQEKPNELIYHTLSTAVNGRSVCYLLASYWETCYGSNTTIIYMLPVKRCKQIIAKILKPQQIICYHSVWKDRFMGWESCDIFLTHMKVASALLPPLFPFGIFMCGAYSMWRVFDLYKLLNHVPIRSKYINHISQTSIAWRPLFLFNVLLCRPCERWLALIIILSW